MCEGENAKSNQFALEEQAVFASICSRFDEVARDFLRCTDIEISDFVTIPLPLTQSNQLGTKKDSNPFFDIFTRVLLEEFGFENIIVTRVGIDRNSLYKKEYLPEYKAKQFTVNSSEILNLSAEKRDSILNDWREKAATVTQCCCRIHGGCNQKCCDELRGDRLEKSS